MAKLAVARALELIEHHVQPLESEWIAPADADGRVTAEAVRAARDVPPFRTSAMDGYAIRMADLAEGPIPLAPIVVSAGDCPAPLGARRAVTIATGAPLPVGADRVILFERARLAEGMVDLDMADRASSDNVRQAGEDMKCGEAI